MYGAEFLYAKQGVEEPHRLEAVLNARNVSLVQGHKEELAGRPCRLADDGAHCVDEKAVNVVLTPRIIEK